MHQGKIDSSDSKEYPSGSLMGKLRERKIIATLAAFVGSGVIVIEVAHHILVNHYHLPYQIVDICIVTVIGALIGTLIWRWFRGVEKRAGKVKVEVLVVPLVILLTLVIDLKFIFVMTGVSVNMLIVGFVALFLGIAWVVFKSLQWAAGVPETEKKAPISPPLEQKPITFPEWKKSIVVLPFENISPEEGQDYFCDGMTEEIITDLSGIHDLCVISRSSAMTFKGTKKTAPEIAKQLNIQYVLEGSVRKAGNNLRITAQLIDAAKDSHLWAEKYNGTLDDVFDIQEKVSRSIADALKLKLSPEENRIISERPIENVPAYELYLKAMSEIFKLTEDALIRAVRNIQNGIDIIGENALLFSAMAWAYIQLVNIGAAQEEAITKAREYVEKALNMDPDCTQAHSALGFVFQAFLGNTQQSVCHFKKALTENPNNAEALGGLGISYIYYAGKISAAVSMEEKLMRIDPLNPFTQYIHGGLPIFDGRFDDAVKVWHKFYEMDPENPTFQTYYAYTLALNNRLSDALQIIGSRIEGSSKNAFSKCALILKYALMKNKKSVFQEITPDFQKTCKRDGSFSHLLAAMLSLLGAKKEALHWLENAAERGFINFPFLAEKDPFLKNIRGEPRFKKLMERVKHEWENFEV